MTIESQFMSKLALSKACRNADMQAIRAIVENPQYQCVAKEINHDFMYSCYLGHQEVVDYLLNQPVLKPFLDVRDNKDNALSAACEGGQLGIVRQLIGLGCSVESNDQAALINACQAGKEEVVKYLLGSPELSEHADIHVNKDLPLRAFATQGNLEMVKYLLTSPELKEHADVHALCDESITSAYENNHLPVVNFLLYDMKMAFNSYHCSEANHPGLKAMFEKRDLFFKLQQDFSSEKYTTIATSRTPKI